MSPKMMQFTRLDQQMPEKRSATDRKQDFNEIYTGWRWPRLVGPIEYRPLDYPKIWRMAQARTDRPIPTTSGSWPSDAHRTSGAIIPS